MNPATAAVLFFSILFPVKTWFLPDQPFMIDVKPQGQAVVLTLTDFAGKPYDLTDASTVAEDRSVDLRQLFPAVKSPGTYILYAVPKEKDLKEFVGTPLLISVRGGPQDPTAAMITRVDSLNYAVMSTDKGEMTMAFYYDVAPNTANSFMRLSQGGFYDGMVFHRIVPGFVVQGGDPLGASPDVSKRGSGSPGYQIDAEFSDRPHDTGVLSMAREGDPIERQGAPPRPEFADSAGSQFFICLKREKVKQLDGRYTVFGKVVAGLDVLQQIAATPVQGDTPLEKRLINSVKVFPVSAGKNPYETLMAVTEETPQSEATADAPATTRPK